ncbi:MAG: amidohydrolase family protein [Myxococcales bacterium]|nr:amidohydrolase family protein [Myxococcales bacterium]TDJ00393.1 MAG: D-aminoacylase [Deltaproteobacteria bacterium]
MHDLVIKGGTIVDGTGAPARTGDIAIEDGRIQELGAVNGAARETIDADGLLVTPGWVDIHTHYDGQATWDPLLTPSCWHGVTTVVMGNCGVGFAPVRPDKHDWLIGLMEGVEDIPGSALAEGIRWSWETFPEYLDALESFPRALDIGTQVPHGPVRGYVMGERGAKNEPATPDDIDAMAGIVKEGIQAGALGFSTSRTIFHRAVDGEPVPGTFAAEEELFGIGRALGELGAGLFELAPAGVMGEDLAAPEKEVAWMRKLSAAIGRPVTFALAQHNVEPDQWRKLLDLSDQAAEEGAQLVPQVGSRPTMLLIGHQTFHPFMDKPSYKAIADLPLAQRVEQLRRPDVRTRILSEKPVDEDPMMFLIHSGLEKIFPLGDPPNYEPAPEASISAIAKREGRTAYEVLYDLMLELEGRQLLMLALLGYSHGNLEAIRAMLEHPRSAFGLGDGGAHCGAICDASMTTFLLTHWVRDRERGPRLPLEWAVRKMTHDTARLYGLNDRGVLAPGRKADLNLIDFERLQLRLPHMVFDLPSGARRLIQEAEGYVATLVSGQVILREGEDSGARPGRLIRGAQPAPA